MKRFVFLLMPVVVGLAACAPTPKPSTFKEFANNEKGAALLVQYIANAKHPIQDRAKAMFALMHHKWDIQVLSAIDKSPDKARLAEAVAKLVIPVYVKLCDEKKPNLNDISYFRDQAFRLLDFMPKDRLGPYQKQIADAVFKGLSLKSSAREVKARISKRIMLEQVRHLGKAGARGALILIHHAFGVSKLAGFLIKLKDKAISLQLFNQIKHIASEPDVKIPLFYLDIAGQVKDVRSLEWLLDMALDDKQELDFQAYAFNVGTTMIDNDVVKEDIPGVVSRLKKFMASDDPDFRWSGVYYMVYVLGTKAMPMVMKALKDDGVYPDADEAPMKTMVDFCNEVMFENGKPIPGAWNAIKMLLRSRNIVHKTLGLVCLKAGGDISRAGLARPFLRSRVKLGRVFGDDKITLGLIANNCVQGLRMMQAVDKALAAKKLTAKEAKVKKFIILAILDKQGKEYDEWVKNSFKDADTGIKKQLKKAKKTHDMKKKTH